MPTELINLELEEVSLVAAGDDPLAKVAIIKCRDIEKEKEPMTEEMKSKLKPYMDKGMSEDEAKKAYDADMEKKSKEDMEKLKAENERLRKAFIDEGYKITVDGVEKKAPEDMIEVEGEMVAKSAIPAPVLKALETAAVAKRDAELVTKAKETLPNFDEAVAKSFMGMELSEAQLQALKAADALFGKMTEEVGKTDVNGDMSDPKAQLDAEIAKVMAEQKVNKAAAYEALSKTKEGKALINKVYYKKED